MGNEMWQALYTPDTLLHPWSVSSTYVKRPPFFEDTVKSHHTSFFLNQHTMYLNTKC